MDNLETTSLETNSFPADLAKSFAVSAVTTAGMVAGFAVVGYVQQKVEQRRSKKAQNATE